MHKVEGEVVKVYGVPVDLQVVVVLVVAVVGVLAEAFFLRCLEGAVNHDEVSLDERPLVVGYLQGSGDVPAEFLQNLVREFLAGGELLGLLRVERGLIGGCEFFRCHC